MSLERGRLAATFDTGLPTERVDVLASAGGSRVEHIQTGSVTGPVEYFQDHDEWVLVLEGLAQLDVAGEPVELEAGDWAVLPGGVGHTVVFVEPGTRWLAVHLSGRAPRPRPG